MHKRIIMVLIVFCCGYCGDKGKMGLTFNVFKPSSAGVIYNLSDNVSLNPSLGFTSYRFVLNRDVYRAFEFTPTIKVLYFLNSDSEGNQYFAAEISENSEIDVPFNDALDNMYVFNSMTITPSYGICYSLSKHISLFGEFGFSAIREKDITWLFEFVPSLGAFFYIN